MRILVNCVMDHSKTALERTLLFSVEFHKLFVVTHMYSSILCTETNWVCTHYSHVILTATFLQIVK